MSDTERYDLLPDEAPGAQAPLEPARAPFDEPAAPPVPAVPAAAAQASESVDPRWRLAAVFARGTERGALVEFSAPGKPPQHLAVGDALPSGHRIVSIGERDLCVRIGSRTYRLGVERSAP